MVKLRSDFLLLAAPGDSTTIVYNHLVRRFGHYPVIMERPVSRARMVRVRLRKLGIRSVLSQLLFILIIKPVLEWQSSGVTQRHCDELGLDRSPVPQNSIINVASVNDQACRDAIRKLNPRFIVVNGTRIIGRKTLSASTAQFVNTHTGIIPRYRGAHGGYWALLNSDPGNCGVTVHLVNSGIDTGDILGQAVITPSHEDCFVTYPYLQLAAALPILENCVARGLEGPLEGHQGTGPSEVWYHPGIVQYLLGRLRGVR